LQQPELRDYLKRAAQVIRSVQGPEPPPFKETPQGALHVAVDLGTAYVVLAVLDENHRPLAGEYQFAEVARDGLVVDFVGAVDIITAMKARVERRLGRELTHAATGYPPGVPQAEVRATGNVVQGAGMTCTGMIDEPTAANAVIGLDNGVIVDVGGGTTGIAIFQDGEVVYTADEPTGGTHFSLVIAGAHDIPFVEAETMKLIIDEQPRLLPIIRPVMEKVATIVTRHIDGYSVNRITLVGGTSAFLGMADVVEEITGLPAWVPDHPALVTPLGIAWYDQPEMDI
jgi:ethanolamine utilization protein EutJ